MQKSRAVAEVASREAELISDNEDALSTSSSSSAGEDAGPASASHPAPSIVVAQDDESEEEFEHRGAGDSKREDAIRERISATQERMHSVMHAFGEDQLHRYEVFRRIGLSRPVIKRLIQRVTEQSTVHANCLIVLAGVAKVFVGEIVEEALDVATEWGDCSADPSASFCLRPSHLVEAQRRLQEKRVLPRIPPMAPIYR